MMRGDSPQRRGWVVVLLLGALVQVGCSRQHFRERADRDVEQIISQKNVFPEWQVQNWHAYPDLRSRFTDPSHPDFPPYPPDDYAARLVSPNPQRPGKGGAGRVEGDGYLQQIVEWDALNRAEAAATAPPAPPAPEKGELGAPPALSAEAENYQNALSSKQQGYLLKLDQTVDLALFNSREFQDRREDLYLAALPVTLERFNLSAQWFAAEQVIRESAGREVPGGGGERWRIGTDNAVNRRFASGAEMLVRLANQIVVDVRDGNPTVSVSTLGLSFIQPLLRGAGFAVTLERLTQVERTLLYAIRSYARFRSVFYNAIVAGGDYTNNPYGLQGLSANLGRGIGANLTARPVGYYPTALRAAILANEQQNIKAIEQYLQQFRNLEEGGIVQKLQVGRVEQRLLNSRALVLRRQQEYADFLDNFKLQLGVPATLPLQLDDTPLKPISRQLQRFEEIYQQLQELELAATEFKAGEDPSLYRARWNKLLTESRLVRGTDFAQQYAQVAPQLARLTADQLKKEIADRLEVRRKLLDEKADRQVKKLPESTVITQKLEAADAELDHLRFEEQLRLYESKPWANLPADRQSAEQAVVFQATLRRGSLLALQARKQRLQSLRNEWPNLPTIFVNQQDLLTAPLDEAYTLVTEAALTNRFDLMNARAQVVDQWRAITVVANSLQSVFDVGYDLETTTPLNGNKPFSFGGSRVLHQIRLRFEPPFVRRAERNNYRAQLISYQRQRRSLQAFEDNIATDTRTDLRTVRQLAQAYLVQLRAVELAYDQVENARSTFLAPPDPRVQDSAGNVAALTQQLLEAQGQLVQAQNELYTTWINYLSARIGLLLDMELLKLDERGQWNDDAITTTRPTDSGERTPERLPAPERLPELALPSIPVAPR